jgi:TPP-dependent pyruvate/acetoin dehydrogenase alpha subunit
MTETGTSMYDQMFSDSLRIRLVEEKIIELYPSDKIQSPVHVSIGEEAVAVGVCGPLSKDDLLFGSYRSHSYYLAKGGDLQLMFAELFGKVTGGCQGKAGSMHLAAPEVGMMGSSAVVASTIPHAVGSALAAKLREKKQVIVAVFGDGATEEGVFHESLNFAALRGLPVIFVCENNSLAVHSPLEDRQAYRIEKLVGAYGVPYARVSEGYDFIRVRDAMVRAVDSVRQNRTPEFLEIQTYRYKEHVGPGDDHQVGYRSVEEFRRWQANDPLMTDTSRVETFTPRIAAEIDQAITFAENSPWPGEDVLLTDVI